MQSYAAVLGPGSSRRTCAPATSALVERGDASCPARPPHEVWHFFAHGMLLNVIASLDLEAIADKDEWAAGVVRAVRDDGGRAGRVSFDADTALEPIGPGRWRAHAAPRTGGSWAAGRTAGSWPHWRRRAAEAGRPRARCAR